MNDDSYNYKSLESIYYYKSIFDTAIRSYNEEDCECTPAPSYFVNKTKFWCMEEYTFEVNKFNKYFETNKSDVVSLQGGQRFYDFINQLPETTEKVTYLDLFELDFNKNDLRNFLLNSNTNHSEAVCWFGPGSGIGCCGNYSGCCWMWHLHCLQHDLACLNCDKWHCGPSCETGL